MAEAKSKAAVENEPRPIHDIVVIGASAGGVEALSTIVERLPNSFGAAVCIVLHVSRVGPSMLADILRKRARLPVPIPEDGRQIETGTIYVAPPDHHLVLEAERVRIIN